MRGPSFQGPPWGRDGENSARVAATLSACDKTVTRPVLPAETAPSWIVVAIILTASVCVACLLLLGFFALLWCIYKKTKYVFARGNKLPQHLKEVSGGVGPAAGHEPGSGAVVPSQAGPPRSGQRVFLERPMSCTAVCSPVPFQRHLWSRNGPNGGGGGWFRKLSLQPGHRSLPDLPSLTHQLLREQR